MLIPGISQVGERIPNARRWVAAARATRPQASAPAPATAEVIAGADRDADDPSVWAPEQGMTLAAAQAAYASY